MASMHPVASRLDTFQRRSSNSSCEAPAEEKLFCSCSSLSASVALMMQPSVPVMANETATAADLCYSCVRCVSLLSRARFLRFWKKKLSPRARLHTLYEMAAWSCMERASGRRTTIRVFLPPTLFDEPATAVTMRRSPSSSDQRARPADASRAPPSWEELPASNRPKLN